MGVETDNPLNEEAADLYTNNMDEFQRRVGENIEQCLSVSVCEEGERERGIHTTDDPLAINFTRMDDTRFKQAKDAMNSFRLTGFFEKIPQDVRMPNVRPPQITDDSANSNNTCKDLLVNQTSTADSSCSTSVSCDVRNVTSAEDKTKDDDANDNTDQYSSTPGVSIGRRHQSRKGPRCLNRRDRSASHRNAVIISY